MTDPMTDPLIKTRRHFLRQSIGSALLTSSASLLPALVHAMGRIPQELVPGKSIYSLRGHVLVDGQPADENTLIKADSLVETGSRSHVIFVVGRDAHILRDNSRVQLQGDDFTTESLRVITGKLLSVFGMREGSEQLEMQTTTGIIGIRGTGIYVESEQSRSYVCTCYGDVVLNVASNPEIRESIVSQHHDAPRYILAEPRDGKMIHPAPVKDHTDDELMLIEQLVGREPPFSTLKTYTAPRKGY